MSQEKLKVFLKIILFLGVTVFIFFLLYLVFFRTPEKKNTPLPEEKILVSLPLPESKTGEQKIRIEKPASLLPQAPEGIRPPKKNEDLIAKGNLTYVTPLVSSPVEHLKILEEAQKNIFYNQKDGKFYSIDKNGATQSLSQSSFPDVKKVTWTNDALKAILEFPDSSKIIYNFSTQKQISLPKHWSNFDFSSSGEEIVGKSLGIDRENRWLIIFNSDGTKVKQIERIGDNDDQIIPDWSPNEQIIALQEKSIDFNRQTISFIGKNKENFRATIAEGRGLLHQWSPNGNRLFYSVYSSDTDLKPILWGVDASGESIGQNRIKIPLNTWADKCAIIDNETALCGAPKYLPKGSGIIRTIADDIPDELFEVDYIRGTVSRIATFEDNQIITQPAVTPDKKFFLFIDGATKELRRIQLK